MAVTIFSAAVVGLDAQIVDVEADTSRGLPKTAIVGLPDAAVQEAKERVRSGIRNSGYDFPPEVVTVNLAPADIRKEGSAFDLPIAVAILAARGIIRDMTKTSQGLFAGELSLDGTIRSVPGILSMVMAAHQAGMRHVFVPADNAAEAALVRGPRVFPVDSLRSVVDHYNGTAAISPYRLHTPARSPAQRPQPDFADVRGHEQAKRALEVAAAGSHNVLMTGPPGSGKTLLARCLPHIMPPLTYDESLTVTKIYSVAGALPSRIAMISQRPYRSPHHTTSGVALVGGGSHPRPGEISLAHRGVLFLDEFPEFSRTVLETLRQPLEDGVVTVSRAAGSVTFPAQFMLVAAKNPCPCGFLNDDRQECTCSPYQIVQYHKKISGPLLDRIDIHIAVPRLDFEKMTSSEKAAPSATIQERVVCARSRQQQRYQDMRILTNNELSAAGVQQHCVCEPAATALLKQAVDQYYLSGRAYHRLLKVARTIADLAGADTIGQDHVAEALQFRQHSALTSG